MLINIVLNDPDRYITYNVTVNARVVAEIGGAPGYCCDVDGVEVHYVRVWFGNWSQAVTLSPHRRKELGWIVERQFDEQIREECIERFQNQPTYVED